MGTFPSSLKKVLLTPLLNYNDIIKTVKDTPPKSCELYPIPTDIYEKKFYFNSHH